MHTTTKLHEIPHMLDDDNTEHEHLMTFFVAALTWECCKSDATTTYLSTPLHEMLVTTTLAYCFFNHNATTKAPILPRSKLLFNDAQQNIDWEIHNHQRKLSKTWWCSLACASLKQLPQEFLNISTTKDNSTNISRDTVIRCLNLLDNSTGTTIAISLHPQIYKRNRLTTTTGLEEPLGCELDPYPDLAELLLSSGNNYSAPLAEVDALIRMVKPDKSDSQRTRAGMKIFNDALIKALTFVNEQNFNNQDTLRCH